MSFVCKNIPSTRKKEKSMIKIEQDSIMYIIESLILDIIVERKDLALFPESIINIYLERSFFFLLISDFI